jgi:hypothetical protein
MCGRFTQHYTWSEIHAFLHLTGPARNLRARYNIAPTTTIDVAIASADGPLLVPMRWGLVPSWWKKPLSERPSTFNARAETGAEKPMLRAAFESRHCLNPASGFYEWMGAKGAKTPHGASTTAKVPRDPPDCATPTSSAGRSAAGPNPAVKLTCKLDHPMGAGQWRMVRLENEIARLRDLLYDHSSELNPLHEMVRQSSYRFERWFSELTAENDRLRFENKRLRKRIADSN